MNTIKKHFDEIDVAKGIGIIFVILGHSFPDAGLDLQNEHSVSGFLYTLCYSFHMPLFVLLAGFVFAPKLNSDFDTKTEINKRFRRLIIPYLFYSIVSFVVKLGFNSYANNPAHISDIWKILIGESDNGGVWFLWTLFFITLLTILARKVNAVTVIVISFILYASVFFINDNSPISFLLPIFRLTLWFVLGCFLYSNYERICRISKKRCVTFGFISFLLLCITNLYFNLNPVENAVLLCLVSFIKTSLGIMAVWFISYSILKNNNTLKNIGNYSMDIYLLSYFVQVPLRVVYNNFDYLSNMPYSLFVVLSLVLGIVIPIVVSKYFIRRVKILRTLFLGMN
ncbi:MAG: acyltransferase family protein [Dysgonomonas sp.]